MKTSCIDAMTLYDFVLDRLGEADRMKVEDHLADCDFCLEQFLAASELLKDEKIGKSARKTGAIPRALLESILSEVRRFFRWAVSPEQDMFAAVLVRNGDCANGNDAGKETGGDYLRLQKTIGNVRLELIWNKTGDRQFSLEVVLPEDEEDCDRYSLLAQKTDGAAAGRIFQDGRAFFNRLSLGEYELILEQDGFESGRYRFLAGQEGILER